MMIFKKAVENCLKAGGYEVRNEDGDEKVVHISTKNENNKKTNQNIIICGAVLNSETGTKEKNINKNDYYRFVIVWMEEETLI